MSNTVECRSEFAYAEKPVVLMWEGQRLEILEILAQWLTPEKKLFRVRVKDGQLFEVTYCQASDNWQIHHIMEIECKKI